MTETMKRRAPVGNVYDKYGSRNPIARALMDGFLRTVGGLYQGVQPRRVLEVGCGEGKLADHLIKLQSPEEFVALDVSLDLLTPEVDRRIRFLEASAYALPFPDSSFDLVVCCEVLEHLEQPEMALAELARVSSDRVLVSTPREPIWRALNIVRGKYVSALGNTPGHLQHFSSRGLARLTAKYFTLENQKAPFPWVVILARTGLRETRGV